MIQTKLKGCAMKKGLIVCMLLLGVFSIQSMEDIDNKKQKRKTTTYRETNIKETIKSKNKKQKRKNIRSDVLGFKTGPIGNDYFEVNVSKISDDNVTSIIHVTIDLTDEDFLEGFLVEGLSIDTRNRDRLRSKRIRRILDIEASSWTKICTLCDQELYSFERLIPLMTLHAQNRAYNEDNGSFFGNKKKKEKGRHKLVKQLTRSSIRSKNKLQKGIIKLKENDG